MTRARSLLVLFALSCVAVGACDDSEPELYQPTYDPNAVTPLPENELCSFLAQNACASIRPCCAPSPYSFEEPKCRAVVRAQCEALRARSHDQSLVYDDVLGGRCAAGFSALVDPTCANFDPTSDPRSYAVDHACRNLWHGGSEVGQPCTDSKTCVQVDGPPVVCQSNGSVRTCTEQQFLESGEPCDVFPNPKCEGSCVCPPWLVCGSTSPTQPVCSERPDKVPVGAACSFDRDCGTTLRCICPDGVALCVQKTCQELPVTGEDCWRSEDGGKQICRIGYRCDHDKGQCVDAKPIGATCGDDSECASQRCVSVCIPGGIVDPITCSGLPNPTVTGLFTFLAPPSTATPGGEPGPK